MRITAKDCNYFNISLFFEYVHTYNGTNSERHICLHNYLSIGQLNNMSVETKSDILSIPMCKRNLNRLEGV